MHLAADVTSTNAVKGLLSGIDVTSSEYYSSKIKMDSREDVAWLMEPGLLWEAAVQDANDMSPEDYIKDIDRECLISRLPEKCTIASSFTMFWTASVIQTRRIAGSSGLC